MFRPRPTSLSAAVAAVGIVMSAVVSGALLAGTAAVAATPSSTPTPLPSGAIGSVSYSGDEHIVSFHTDGSVGRDVTQTITVQVLCTEPGVCSLRAFGGTTKLKAGIGTLKTAESGDRCAVRNWVPESVLTIEATDTRMLATLLQKGVPDVICNGGHNSIDSQDVTFTGKVSGGTPCLVLGTCPSPTPTAIASGSTSGAAGPRAASTPSVLSALPTAATALTPRNALWAVAAAVILVLLIALPTQLFNSASEKASEQIGAWWTRVRPRRGSGSGSEADAEGDPAGVTDADAAPAPKTPVAWSGWPFAAVGVLAASVISAFVDPAIGFDAAGLRTVLSILVSFVLDVVIGWFVLVLIVRRTHPQSIATFEFKPLTLVVVAAAVLLTRLTGFQPGIVFGLVAGIVFGGVIGTAKARVALIGLGYSFGIGVVAWIAYSAVSAASGANPVAAVVFLEETLSSAAIAGIAALPIALLPIGSLVGREVWRWNRWIWAAAYALGLIGFFLVLMPMPFAWAEVPLSLWTWIGLYLAYAVGAVVVWLVITRPWRREPATA